MIGSIEGIIELKDYPYLVINVNGVGYKLLIPNNLFSQLKIGSKTKFFTHTYVREDILDLFGFSDISELKLFQRLIGVSGVGPKTAIAIFSFGSKDEIVAAIIKGDVSFFTNVPRLGKKNAQKIIIELKGKLGSIEDLDLSEATTKENVELVGVLKNFGFTAQEAKEAIRAIQEKGETMEEKVKLALKYLGR